MKENETISTPHEDLSDSVFWPPVLEDGVVLTTSGPVREALERHMAEQRGEREMIWERRYLGRWVYKDK